MTRIFISYKRVDKDKVFKIKDQVESATGEKCWIDLDGIESDAQFANVIIKAINECEVFLFMYSAAHSQITDYKNDWTVRELDFAQHKKKRIVFVNLDSSPLSDWFYLLFGTMQQVDATSSKSILRLIFDIEKWLNLSRERTKVSSIVSDATDNSLNADASILPGFRMEIEDVAFISGRGAVVTGRILTGRVKVGDDLILIGQSIKKIVKVLGIEKDRKLWTEANIDESVGLLLSGVKESEITIGMALLKL